MIRQQGISRTGRRPRGVSVGSMTAAPRRNKETARAAPTERRTSCKRKQGPSGEPETAVAGTRPCRFRNGRGLTQTIAPPLDARNASKVVASSSPAMSFNRYAGTRRSTRSISSAFPSPVAAHLYRYTKATQVRSPIRSAGVDKKCNSCLIRTLIDGMTPRAIVSVRSRAFPLSRWNRHRELASHVRPGADRSLLAVRRAFLGEWIHKPDVLGLSWGSLWTHRGFDCGRADEAGIGGVSAGLTKRQVKIVEISMNSAPAKKRA